MTPFVPKSWGNFSTGGTPLNAAGLNDLESRISGSVNAGANSTGAIYAYDYGVRSDGSTPSAAALQAACNVAATGFGTVLVPGGQGAGRIKMEGPVFIPNGVQVVGTGRQGTVFDAITSGVNTFPSSTPMFYLGSNVFLEPCFDTRLVNCAVDMKDIPDSIGVYSRNIQEGGGLQGVGIYNFRRYGVHMNTGGAQNFRCRDLTVYASPTFGALAGVFYDSIGSTSTLEWCTTVMFNTGYGVWVRSSYAVPLNQIHTEASPEGIRIEDSQASIIGAWGHIGCPIFIRFTSGSQWGTVINSNNGESAVHLVDDASNVTINGPSQIGFYTQRYAYPLPGIFSLPFSASMTPNAAGRHWTINVISATPSTMNAPSEILVPGMEMTFDILNSTGGAIGLITWNAVYKLAGAFVNPGAGKRRLITFYYDGTNWVETSRSPADI